MQLNLTPNVLPKELADSLVDTVRELANKYPEAVYCNNGGRCEYAAGDVKNGPDTPGCVVGQGIAIVAPEYSPKIRDSASSVAGLFGDLECSLKIRWLSVVQSKQDCGYTWSQAVNAADSFIGLMVRINAP